MSQATVMDSAPSRNRIYLLYCCSGFISLAYQICWFRTYVDKFGSSTFTFTVVLCSFIVGLGLGAMASQRIVTSLRQRTRLKDDLRIYGLLEILIAVSVLLIFLVKLIPADLLGSDPYYAVQNAAGLRIHKLILSYYVLQLLTTVVCVFLPCFLMGTTFPLLCQVFQREERFPSTLYAWNTLGACLGILVCQFVFMSILGHSLTLWLMVFANILLGAYFLVSGTPAALSHWLATAVADSGSASPSPGTHSQEAQQKREYLSDHRKESRHRKSTRKRNQQADTVNSMVSERMLLIVATISGFLVGALEADMFKRVGFFNDQTAVAMSFTSFWSIAGIFVGSVLVRRLRRLGWNTLKISAIAAWLVYLVLASPKVQYALGGLVGITSLLGLLILTGILVFVPLVLLSMLFPYICNRMQGARRHLGFAYGINSLAFGLGMIAFTWLAPRVSIFYSMKLIHIVVGIGVLFLASLSAQRSIAIWQPVVAGLALVIGCLVTPRGFDVNYVHPNGPAARFPHRSLKSDGAHTTYIVEHPDGDRLFFDNHSMTGVNYPSLLYMRLMAHFPLLTHPQPQKALLICFGVGTTASAIEMHDTIHTLDIVDLSRAVIDTAPEFRRTNYGVYASPKVRLINDDGRAYLNLTQQTYDLITSEPPAPLLEGVYRLYSKEYYQGALDRLGENGLMSQWLPVWTMPQEAVDLAVATFVDVFPNTLMFSGHGHEFILLGSRSPIDLNQLETRFGEQASVRADMERLRVTKPVQLLARIVKTDKELRDQYGGQPVISDARNDFAYLVLDEEQRPIVSYDPFTVLQDLEERDLQSIDQLREIMMDFGRLKYSVNDFPAESMLTSPFKNNLPVRANVDWVAIGREELAAHDAEMRGEKERAFRHLEVALTYADEQPYIVLLMADNRIQANQGQQAIPLLEQLKKLVPADATADSRLGYVYWKREQFDLAEKHFRQAIEVDPQYAEARMLLAGMFKEQDDIEGAKGVYQEAIQVRPRHAAALNELALLHADQNEFADAILYFRRATEADPSSSEYSQNLARAEQVRNQGDR